MNTLDETVERLAKAAELVLRVDGHAPGQVTFAFGNVMHGATHQVQGLHQYADQQAEQGDDDQYRDHRRDDGRGT
ncbi:hypothetical protein D3C79_737980 [compost metagenome]